MNRTSSPGHRDAEDSRILFVEDGDTLLPSDYSACQVSIKGRALGGSATLVFMILHHPVIALFLPFKLFDINFHLLAFSNFTV